MQALVRCYPIDRPAKMQLRTAAVRIIQPHDGAFVSETLRSPTCGTDETTVHAAWVIVGMDGYLRLMSITRVNVIRAAVLRSERLGRLAG
jgi:hypothetical protein